MKTRNTIQTQLRPCPQTSTASVSVSPTTAGSASPEGDSDVAALKLELLASLRSDIADIFKKGLQETLGDALSTIKLDLQAMKTQVAKDRADTDATVATLKGTIGDVEHALSECTDDITQMKTTIECLSAGGQVGK